MLVEILYCSVSVPSQLTNADFDHILATARRRNVSENITGMLLYYRGEFVQILEVPRSKSKCNNFQKEIVHEKNLPTSAA